VDDSRPELPADSFQVADVVKERVDESPRAVPRRGMDDESGRLVDGEEVLVLEEDREGNVFRLDGGLFRIGNVDGNLVARVHGVRAPGRRAGDSDRAFLDELLDSRAGKVEQTETR
jgi:hypothetical protein